MSKMLKDLQKKIKAHHLISALAVGLVIYMIYRVVSRTNESKDGMGGGRQTVSQQSAADIASAGNAGTAQPAAPVGQNEEYESVSGMGGGAQGLPPSCNAQKHLNASDLLPSDQHSQFADMAPGGQGALNGINLLTAGQHHGINTVGNSLRNANQQLRSEPPNPTQTVSPWNNTTISPDLMRTPLELGSSPIQTN